MRSFPDWPRPLYKRGGGDALVLYTVFGKAPKQFDLTTDYRTSGIPESVEIYLQTKDQAPSSFALAREGAVGAELGRNPALAKLIRAQSDCVVLQGQVKDPPSLNYLRDTIGLVTWLLDQGCVGVLDILMAKWWSREEWRKSIFEPAQASPLRHTVILYSPEGDGTEWFHSRGMRKFGRPDISVRFVPAQHRAAIAAMCNRLIVMQAQGALIPQGQEITMQGLPPGMRAYHWGRMDDLAFNNVHIEIAWPDKRRLGPPD
jgi:hypothetical protein